VVEAGLSVAQVRPAVRDLVGGGSVGTLSGGVGRISERRRHEPQGGGAGPLGGGGAGPPGGGCGNGVMGGRRMKTVAAVRNLEPEKNRYRLYPSPIFIGVTDRLYLLTRRSIYSSVQSHH
jgi:hypothetical protein